MEKVVIVDAVRTPMGRSKSGAFRQVRAEDLSAHLIRELLSRNLAVDAAALDDIIWGYVQQTLEQGFNIARNAVLLAEIPHRVPASTVVKRLCGSSMQALHDAARAPGLATQRDDFQREIVFTYGHDADGLLKRYETDEVIREDTSLDGLAACGQPSIRSMAR